MTATCCNPVTVATARVLPVRCPRHAVTVAPGDCVWSPALPPRFSAPASVVCNHAPTDPAPVQPNAAASRQPPPSTTRPRRLGQAVPNGGAWKRLNVPIDHLIYPAASRVLASTGASAQRPAASQVPLAALLEESVPLYHLPDPHCLPYRSSRGTSSPPPRAATAASSGSNLPPRETAGVARWTSTRGNRSSATFLFSCPSSTTIHIPERQGPEAPHSKTRPHRRRHPPGPRRPPGFGMRCSAAPQPSAGEARRCWPTIVQE